MSRPTNAELKRENQKLMAALVDQGVTIKDLNDELEPLRDRLQISRELAHERLKLLKTAKADGIQEAVMAISHKLGSGENSRVLSETKGYAFVDDYVNQLEADNEAST